LMHNANSIAAQTRREFRGDVPSLCTFYRFYYRRIWQKRPHRLLEKVARQMIMFYLPYCRAYEPGISRKLSERYELGIAPLSYPIYRKVWMAYPPAVDFMTRTQELAQRALRFQQPFIIPVVLYLIAICYSIWLVATLVF